MDTLLQQPRVGGALLQKFPPFHNDWKCTALKKVVLDLFDSSARESDKYFYKNQGYRTSSISLSIFRRDRLRISILLSKKHVKSEEIRTYERPTSLITLSFLGALL